jgi:predicted transcriptional regulator of viral defense system
MIKKSIELKEALKMLVVEEHDKPVICLYELAIYIYKLYQDKELNGHQIRKVVNDEPERRTIDSNINELVSQGVLTSSHNHDHTAYFISGQRKPTAQQYVCSVNPFCYIAYISAMEWHGITDRIPNTIQLVTCSSRKYKDLMSSHLNNTIPNVNFASNLLPTRAFSLYSFDNKNFEFHQSNKFNLPKAQFGSGGVRVSSLGDTFLDMLKKPDLCGGFNHVLDVFLECAEKYLPTIVKSINKNGTAIDKARAGYILEELCNLEHRLINSWKEGVSRGGSRRLVYSNPYKHVYSETWCISINM